MGREVKVGIAVSATGTIDDDLESMADGADDAEGKIRNLGDSGADAFEGLGGAVTNFNQALEIGRKALAAFDATFVESIRRSLEFRGENDEAVKTFRQFSDAIDVLVARIGDVFLPLLVTAAKALMPVVKATTDWIIANRELIGSGLISFLQTTGSILVNVVAFAIVEVARQFSMLSNAIDIVQGFFQSLVALMVKGLKQMLDGISTVADALGQDGIAGSLGEASSSLESFRQEMLESARANVSAAVEGGKAFLDFEGSVNRAAESLSVALVEGAAAARIAIDDLGIGLDMNRERQQMEKDLAAEALAERLAGIDALSAKRQEQIDFELELLEAQLAKEAELEEMRRAAFQEIAETGVAAATQVGDTFGRALAIGIKSTEDLGDAFKDLGKTIIQQVLAAAQKFVIAKAVEAAASALSGSVEEFGPIVGLILGAGLAAAAFGAVSALVSSLNEGGFVQGSDRSDRDSELVALTPGEFVMSRTQVGAFRKFITQVAGSGVASQVSQGVDPGNQAVQQQVSGPGGGGGQTIINNFTSQLQTPARVEALRFERDNADTVERLQKRGMFPGTRRMARGVT